jgi:hypothetical protein
LTRLRRVCSGNVPILAQIPQAQLDLAKACEEGGAEALVVPIMDRYSATLEFESGFIKEIISTLSIPIGIYLGSTLKESEWEEILNMNVDFVASLPQIIPPFAAFDNRIDKLIYVPSGLSVEVYRALSSVEGVVSLVYIPHSQVKDDKYFNMLDVLNLGIISRHSFKPVFFKVSKDVKRDDIPLLIKWGCSGLMLDPSYTGSTPEHYKEFISNYREVLKGRETSRYFGFPSWG